MTRHGKQATPVKRTQSAAVTEFNNNGIMEQESKQLTNNMTIVKHHGNWT